MRTLTLSPTQPAIRALHSLRSIDADFARLAIRAFAPAWQIDQHDDYTGHLVLIITPTGADAVLPTFIVQGTPSGIELAETDSHVYTVLGTFQTVSAAIRVVEQINQANPPLDRH